MVIGINHPYSLDHSKNIEFYHAVSTLAKVEGISYRLLGFLWIPEWESSGYTSSHLIYKKEKAYTLLKTFSVNIALKVLDDQKVNISTQIPFQKIRERIKRSNETTSYAAHFVRTVPLSPLYFSVMDGDCRSLRSPQGLFSVIDEAVMINNSPSAITTGYRLKNDESELLRLGVKLDMCVRAAMNRQIPFSCYYPEPATFFSIRQPNGSFILDKLSFIGKGNGLENRRLIQNARSAGLFKESIFLNTGNLVTTTPERMRTNKNQTMIQLSLNVLKQKGTLEALHNVAQTHATKKQWADNLYLALDFKASRVTDVTTPLMWFFGVYDPISRMYVRGENKGKFASKHFDEIIYSYREPLTDIQKEVLSDAKNALKKLKMPNDKIRQVHDAARVSGEAIYLVLLQALNDLQQREWNPTYKVRF